MGVATGTFLLFAASQVGTPGPANMAMLTTGARFGLRGAIPFVGGVVLGKQLIIWPLGLGLMQLVTQSPWIFDTLKWMSAAYICLLAWQVANMKLSLGESKASAPGFSAGLAVHPLNPKAWAMITVGFTSFVSAGTPALQATATIAICLFACQLILHPVWTYSGEWIAARFTDRAAERYLMGSLAALTVASVLFVLFQGAKA